MPVKNDGSTGFRDEIRFIPRWAYFLALLAFLIPPGVMVAVFFAQPARLEHPMPLVLLMAAVAGTLLAAYVLLIGYVNQDAGRRGMSRLLWTLLAILIPNGLGLLLYFVLRKPRQSRCPQCGAIVEPGFGFCPGCRFRLNPVCPQCQRGVSAGSKFCPYCGAEVGTGDL